RAPEISGGERTQSVGHEPFAALEITVAGDVHQGNLQLVLCVLAFQPVNQIEAHEIPPFWDLPQLIAFASRRYGVAVFPNERISIPVACPKANETGKPGKSIRNPL